MSTENEGPEGTARPAAPSVPAAPAVPPAAPAPVPPVPAAAPEGGQPAPALPPFSSDSSGSSGSSGGSSGFSGAAGGGSVPGAGVDSGAPGSGAPGGTPPYTAETVPAAAHGQPSPAEPPTAPLPGAVPPAPGPNAPGATSPYGTDGSWPPPPPAQPAYGGGAAWGAPVPAGGPPRRKRSGGAIVAVLAAALLVGGVGGGIGYWAAERNDDGISSTTVSASGLPEDLKRDPGTVAAVAAKALPSVVTIQAKAGTRPDASADGLGGGGEGGGSGTGFVYDQEGHILTNNHVVASAAEGGTLSATFSNGKSYEAEVVGRAQGYDVAVLKLKSPPSGLAPLALGDSDRVAIGDATIAIGAPFGLSNTVTTGIVSAKDRPVAAGGGGGGANSYMSALQTDASINPGNSGGPLLDARGAVIGINSAIQSTGGGFGQSQAGSIGLGFAIPINQAKNVAEKLIKTGEPVYPVIGATVDLASRGEGARITNNEPAGGGSSPAILPNGPAAKAGLKVGDVITRFNDKPIDSGPTLISEIWTHKPGDTVKLTYQRSGEETTVSLTLGSRTGDN
ncbi:S1C family serine protease [Streptomyces sp. NPDC057638]|uniref:S1C family serine protease n=1 Tax=Streptomyces sp. NPDC057638 TaxID=3346190 RepID=UPI0036A217B9